MTEPAPPPSSRPRPPNDLRDVARHYAQSASRMLAAGDAADRAAKALGVEAVELVAELARPCLRLLDGAAGIAGGAGDVYGWLAERAGFARQMLVHAREHAHGEHDACGVPTWPEINGALTEAWDEAAPLRPAEPSSAPPDAAPIDPPMRGETWSAYHTRTAGRCASPFDDLDPSDLRWDTSRRTWRANLDGEDSTRPTLGGARSDALAREYVARFVAASPESSAGRAVAALRGWLDFIAMGEVPS